MKEPGHMGRPNAVNAFRVLRVVVVFALTIVFGYGSNESAAGATLPQGFSETMVSGGLSSPTAMDFAPDGRLFVCLQAGQLRVIKNGTLLATPFLAVLATLVDVIVRDKDPAEEDVPAVLFAKESRT